MGCRALYLLREARSLTWLTRSGTAGSEAGYPTSLPRYGKAYIKIDKTVWKR